jgi:hypothetical protein
LANYDRYRERDQLILEFSLVSGTYSHRLFGTPRKREKKQSQIRKPQLRKWGLGRPRWGISERNNIDSFYGV